MSDLTEYDHRLLTDIAEYRVADNDDCLPVLHLDDEPDADVSTAVWRYRAAGWAHQPDGPGWRLTPTGEDVKARRRHP